MAKQTLVLAWNQFVYAEGSDDEIRMAFASHDVIVRGSAAIMSRRFAGPLVGSNSQLPRCDVFARSRFGGSMPNDLERETASAV